MSLSKLDERPAPIVKARDESPCLSLGIQGRLNPAEIDASVILNVEVHDLNVRLPAFPCCDDPMDAKVPSGDCDTFGLIEVEGLSIGQLSEGL